MFIPAWAFVAFFAVVFPLGFYALWSWLLHLIASGDQ